MNNTNIKIDINELSFELQNRCKLKPIKDIKKGELIFVTHVKSTPKFLFLAKYSGEYNMKAINEEDPNKRYYEYEYNMKIVLSMSEDETNNFIEGNIVQGNTPSLYPNGKSIAIYVFNGNLEDAKKIIKDIEKEQE